VKRSSRFVTVDWDDSDAKSIRDAEKKKARLENDGYSLYREVRGLFRGKMIYVRDEEV